jgi:hypothetical protein
MPVAHSMRTNPGMNSKETPVTDFGGTTGAESASMHGQA